MMQRHVLLPAAAFTLVAIASLPVLAQQQPARGLAAAETSAVATLPTGYVIGPQDVLNIRFWKDADMSPGDVIVRPDGKISTPLLNDIQAAGRTPEELRLALMEAASKFLEDPNAIVQVKAINSRLVYITGQVVKPGAYPLNVEMDVIQMLALAGGLLEYADAGKIIIMRTQNGKVSYHTFNYKEVLKQKNVQQNIQLRPGDRVVVP